MVKPYDPKGVEGTEQLLPKVRFCKSSYETVKGADVFFILTAVKNYKEFDLKSEERPGHRP